MHLVLTEGSLIMPVGQSQSLDGRTHGHIINKNLKPPNGAGVSDALETDPATQVS